MTGRHFLDVLFILVFTSIVVYTSLFTLTSLYFFTLTYLYLSLYYYVNLTKLLIYEEYGDYGKIFQIEEYSSKVLKITVRFILAIYLFSRVSLHLQRKTIILCCEEKIYRN